MITPNSTHHTGNRGLSHASEAKWDCEAVEEVAFAPEVERKTLTVPSGVRRGRTQTGLSQVSLRPACSNSGLFQRLHCPSFPKAALAFLVCATLTACAHLAPSRRLQHPPGSRPVPREILAVLAENDAKIIDFHAVGTFTIAAPEFAAKKLCTGDVVYRKPASLHITGRHRTWGNVVFLLTSVGKEFLLTFPGEDAQPYYYHEGAAVEGVDFSVSPSDIVREMYFPESWGELPLREVRVADYDSAAHIAVLLIGPAGRPRRRVEVAGPHWDVVRNELLGEDGQVTAVTRLAGYDTFDGIRFPMEVESRFPAKETEMSIRLRKIDFNTGVADSAFAFDWPEPYDQPAD